MTYDVDKLNKIKTEYLLNKNGKIEGQRLAESFFALRNLHAEFAYIKELGITSTKDLYDVENPQYNKGICICGVQKKFRTYSTGYAELCGRCSNQKFNYRKGITTIKLDEVPAFVKNKNGGYTNNKIKTLSSETINEIIERTNYLKDTSKPVTMSERIYHIEHNLTKPVECLGCHGYNNNFLTSFRGYQDGCLINKCSQNILFDFKSRTMKQRAALYPELYKKYSNKEQLNLNEDYKIISLTDETHYNSIKELVITLKHNCGHEYVRSHKFQGLWRCPKCFARKSEGQHQLYVFIQKILGVTQTDLSSVVFDTRTVITPKELDIFVPSKNIAIEFNGTMFHSFGSVKNPRSQEEHCKADEFERKESHLDKTEACDNLGIQLFHIFSNEYELKPEIWESVLQNALGKSNRIYARKTVVKEVHNQEAKEFQENNHLQGAVNAPIKLGLYYNEELVSLMTFGKSRYSKDAEYAEYELLRFCSKLNTSVVGGASKLLKYFEKTYSPKYIISYANRRWSQGNLYDALGFEFTHNTKPNYFYFKYNSNLLESRVKFQKHKLKDILDIFDPKLTETENMYNNNYRKIYDSGNKVYIKKY